MQKYYLFEIGNKHDFVSSKSKCPIRYFHHLKTYLYKQKIIWVKMYTSVEI